MQVLLILAGEPPSLDLIKTFWDSSALHVAVDGGIQCFKDHSLPPDLHLGDMDSADPYSVGDKTHVALDDQAHTDLEKSLHYLMSMYEVHSWVILGGGGGRVDHLFNNLQFCASLPAHHKVLFVNDIGSQYHPDRREGRELLFRLKCGQLTDLRVSVGTTISILPVGQIAGLRTSGLEWEIHGEINNKEAILSQSNRAMVTDPSFTLSDGSAYIVVYQ